MGSNPAYELPGVMRYAMRNYPSCALTPCRSLGAPRNSMRAFTSPGHGRPKGVDMIPNHQNTTVASIPANTPIENAFRNGVFHGKNLRLARIYVKRKVPAAISGSYFHRIISPYAVLTLVTKNTKMIDQPRLAPLPIPS